MRKKDEYEKDIVIVFGVCDALGYDADAGIR